MSALFVVTFCLTMLIIVLSLQFCYKGFKKKDMDLFVEGLMTLFIGLCFGAFLLIK